MAKRLPSPTDDDIDRIAETLKNLDSERNIDSQEEFDNAYDNYFEGQEDMKENIRVRGQVKTEFRRLTGRHLRRVIPEDEQQEQTKQIKRAKRFQFPRKVKNQVVFTEKTSITIQGKTRVRFRDKKGRFTSN